MWGKGNGLNKLRNGVLEHKTLDQGTGCWNMRRGDFENGSRVRERRVGSVRWGSKVGEWGGGVRKWGDGVGDRGVGV